MISPNLSSSKKNFLSNQVCYIDKIISKIESLRADSVKEALQLIDRDSQAEKQYQMTKKALDEQTEAIKKIKLQINYTENNTYTQNNTFTQNNNININ